MSLEDVFDHVIDHLPLVDIVSVWEVLGVPSLNKEVISVLCKRIKLKYRAKYSMQHIVLKFRTTCRCSTCGVPTRCVVVKNRRRELLCTDCAPSCLVSRNQVRHILSTYPKEIQKRVTKSPWLTSGLKLARKAPHGGAYLYWKSDVLKIVEQVQKQIS